MARFYGNMLGQARTDVTRVGGANSGIFAHLRGWDVGVKVEGSARGERDVFTVYASSGSNGAALDVKVATIENVNGKIVVTPSA